MHRALFSEPPILDHSSIYAKAAAPLGNNAELTCVAIGIPDVKFSWQRDTRTGTDLNRRSQLPLVTETDRISVSSKKIGFMRYQVRKLDVSFRDGNRVLLFSGSNDNPRCPRERLWHLSLHC